MIKTFLLVHTTSTSYDLVALSKSPDMTCDVIITMTTSLTDTMVTVTRTTPTRMVATSGCFTPAVSNMSVL